MRTLGLSCLLAVLVAGCGGGPTEPAKRIAAWRISGDVFIPEVDPVPRPAPRTKPRSVAPAARSDGGEPEAGGDALDSGAPSDAEVRRQLQQLYGEAGGADPGSARTLSLSGGIAAVPPDAPDEVHALVSAANQVASALRLPGPRSSASPAHVHTLTHADLRLTAPASARAIRPWPVT